MIGHPAHLLVQLNHTIANRRHLDEPRTYCFIYEWLSCSPTVRVSVIVSFMTKHDATLFEHANDRWVGIKDELPFKVGNFTGETSARINRNNQVDSCFLTHPLVIFTKTWRHVHHTGAIFSRNKIARDHSKRIWLIGKIIEQRLVSSAHQLRAQNCFENFYIRKLSLVCRQSLTRNN